MRLPLTRAFGPVTTLVLLVLGGTWWITRPPLESAADGERAAARGADEADSPRSGGEASPEAAGEADARSADDGVSEPPAASIAKPADRILVATYNLDGFGAAKSESPAVMAVVADILRRFDVVALQEIDSPDAEAFDRLVDQVNVAGARYRSLLGPPLGRSAPRRQYAFLWDSRRVRIVRDSGYTVRDEADLMRCEPLVASFEVATALPSGRTPFRFTVINARLDPDDADRELAVLKDVFLSVRRYEYPEDDILLAGTLQAEPDALGPLGAIAGLTSLAARYKTDTAGARTGTHLLVDRLATGELTGDAGVIAYERHLGLNRDQAIRVSAHRPVWAAMRVEEHSSGGGAMAEAAALDRR